MPDRHRYLEPVDGSTQQTYFVAIHLGQGQAESGFAKRRPITRLHSDSRFYEPVCKFLPRFLRWSDGSAPRSSPPTRWRPHPEQSRTTTLSDGSLGRHLLLQADTD